MYGVHQGCKDNQIRDHQSRRRVDLQWADSPMLCGRTWWHSGSVSPCDLTQLETKAGFFLQLWGNGDRISGQMGNTFPFLSGFLFFCDTHLASGYSMAVHLEMRESVVTYKDPHKNKPTMLLYTMGVLRCWDPHLRSQIHEIFRGCNVYPRLKVGWAWISSFPKSSPMLGCLCTLQVPESLILM